MAQIVARGDAEADQAAVVRRRRSVVLALLLAGLAVLFYVTSIVRLGADVALRNF